MFNKNSKARKKVIPLALSLCTMSTNFEAKTNAFGPENLSTTQVAKCVGAAGAAGALLGGLGAFGGAYCADAKHKMWIISLGLVLGTAIGSAVPLSSLSVSKWILSIFGEKTKNIDNRNNVVYTPNQLKNKKSDSKDTSLKADATVFILLLVRLKGFRYSQLFAFNNEDFSNRIYEVQRTLFWDNASLGRAAMDIVTNARSEYEQTLSNQQKSDDPSLRKKLEQKAVQEFIQRLSLTFSTNEELKEFGTKLKVANESLKHLNEQLNNKIAEKIKDANAKKEAG